MKSLATFTAGLLAITLPSRAAATSIFDLFRTRQADPPSCNAASVVCPGCDGRNFTDDTGHRWTITCDFAIHADSEVPVGGEVSISICLDACNDNDACFGVTFATNGSCVVASGNRKGLTYTPGDINMVRLAAATPDTSSSNAGLTRTISGSSVTRTSRASLSTTTTQTAPSSTYTGMSGECNLNDDDMCPDCSGEVAVDSNGKAYRVLCDTSINSNGSYSPQEWLSPEECLQECDKYDFCTGVTYYGERNCELAKSDPDTVFDESFTAFLPLLTPTASPSAGMSTSRTQTRNVSMTAASATATQPTISIQPINPGCNISAVTCDACDGYPVTDRLNASYTAVCDQEPMCTDLDRRGQATQEDCLQMCDQDVTCMAALWAANSSSCNLCLRGMVTSRVAGPLPYVLLSADGSENTTSSSSAVLSTVAATSHAYNITDLPAPFPSETTRSKVGPVGPVVLPTASSTNATTAAGTTGTPLARTPSAVPKQTAVTCPESDNIVYTDPDSNAAFAVSCDSRFDAAHSAYVTASDFEACAALCTSSCDGVQFGATNRCGLYTDITFIGGAPSWTAAARITVLPSNGLHASGTRDATNTGGSGTSTLSTVSRASTVNYASPIAGSIWNSVRSNATAAAHSPGVTTRAGPAPYSAA